MNCLQCLRLGLLQRLFFLFLVWFLASCFCWSDSYHALLIGNQNYDDRNWKSLTTPHEDVDDLHRILEDFYGFEVVKRKDQNRRQIIDLIESYKDVLKVGDNLLIYYAGHGHVRDSSSYWVGIDASKDSRADWLKSSTISELLDRKGSGVQAKHVLVIADSCYGGIVDPRNKSDVGEAVIGRTIRNRDKNNNSLILGKYNDEKRARWLNRISLAPARIIFSSGGDKPVADRIGNATNSIFAQELTDQLMGVANQKVVITALELYSLLAPEVFERSRLYLDNGQAPTYRKIPGTGDLDGDFIFVPNGANIRNFESLSVVSNPMTFRSLDQGSNIQLKKLCETSEGRSRLEYVILGGQPDFQELEIQYSEKSKEIAECINTVVKTEENKLLHFTSINPRLRGTILHSDNMTEVAKNLRDLFVRDVQDIDWKLRRVEDLDSKVRVILF